MASSDGYILFTQILRLYVQGVREAIRDRLVVAFGDEWWEKGVEYALQGNLLKGIQDVVEKNPGHERHLFIDTSHFGWIIVKHHNEVFADAFGDTVRTFNDLRWLNELRNEWAHRYDIAPARAVQAANLMKSILASLRREEALEIERMSQEFVLDPADRHAEDSIDYMDPPGGRAESLNIPVTPLELWRQLESYLVLEKFVRLPEDEENEFAEVTIRVHNTAPASSDWPAVYFRSLDVVTLGGYSQGLGGLGPGETREVVFSFPVKQLMAVDFRLSGGIDPARLLTFERATGLPAEVIAPLRKEFVSRLESVGVKEFVNGALDSTGTLGPEMTLASISKVREEIRLMSSTGAEKQEALHTLSRDFQLDRDSGLGYRLSEIIGSLHQFGEKLDALDAAIGSTNLTVISEAVQDLKQIQLAVLRLEDTIRTITRSE